MSENQQQVEAGAAAPEPARSEPGVLRKIGRVVFRLLLAILVGLAVGVGLYFGALRLYRETLEPIQRYEERITKLERSLEQLRQGLGTDAEALKAGQAALEGRLAEQAEGIASVEALIQAAQQEVREQRRILGALGGLSQDVEELNLAVGSLAQLVEDLENEVISGDLPARRVQRTAVYLQAMSLLTRAQLELGRMNYGFAEEQIVAAQAALAELTAVDTEQEPYGDEELLTTILERLDIVVADIPARPESASRGLEAVWSLVLEAMQSGAEEPASAGGE